MDYGFPRIQLDNNQQLWLETLYEALKSNVQVDQRAVKAKLWGKIAQDFDPWQMLDSRLSSAGRRISLLGIWHVDPNSEYLGLFDRAIRLVRTKLINEPLLQQLAVKDLAKDLGTDGFKVKQVIELLNDYGSNQIVLDAANDLILIGGEPGFDVFYQYTDLTAYAKKVFAVRERVAFAQPMLPVSDSAVVQGTAFVLMAMDKKKKMLDDVFSAIKRVCESFEVEAYRIDDVEPPGQITDEILRCIRTAQYVVADLSGERPNVYYEIGYAKGLGKNPILLKSQDTKVHFDLSVHKITEYESLTELERQLTERLENVIGVPPRKK